MTAKLNSLQSLCLACIVEEETAFYPVLQHHLPSRIMSMLLTAAFCLHRKNQRASRRAVLHLVAGWKNDTLTLKDVLPQEKSILTADEKYQVIYHVMEGLLSLPESTHLRVVDFRGACMPALFQLPLLAIPQEDRISDDILEEIHKVCKSSLGDHDQDSLLAVLSWKLAEMGKEPSHSCQCKGPIDVYVETQLNLAEWIAVVDEMLALILQYKTPFRIKICRLAIENFTLQQAPALRWILSNVDKEKLFSLGIYGMRKSISMVIWHFHDQLVQFTKLKIFALASVGPPLIKNIDTSGPTQQQLLKRTQEVFRTWTQLEEVYFNRIHVSNDVEAMLSQLQSPLKLMYFYAAELRQPDVAYIVKSHHIHALKSLTIEKNKLRGMGEEMSEMGRHAYSIETLSLKDTDMQLHEKVGLMTSLQLSQTINVLVLHESEDMVSTDGYQQLVELACSMKNLKCFYVFPFCYKPFEIFFRKKAQEVCEAILSAYKRTDISLFY